MSKASERLVIGLGGPIGGGIEAVVGMLRRLGYAIVDADEVAHSLLQPAAPAYQQLTDRFGVEILDGSGAIDHARLLHAARAEANPEQGLPSILSPLVKQEVRSLIATSASRFVFVTAHDLEAYGLAGLCCKKWIVTASAHARVVNLAQAHGWPVELARRLVQSDGVDGAEFTQADFVLHNDGARSSLWSELTGALRNLEAQVEPVGGSISRETPEARVDAAAAHATALEGARVPAASRALLASAARGRDSKALQQPQPSARSFERRQLQRIGQRIANALFILISIAFLTSWGLILAESGRQRVPVQPLQAAWQAVEKTGQYISAHPASYYWARQQVPWMELVGKTLGHSAGLLLLSMVVALLVGFSLGIGAATAGRKVSSAGIIVLSALGASTPSFLVGMLLWALNIWVHRTFDLQVLPASGFGWDGHLVMPALVLAMRPLAQISQITYVSARDALQQDYVRTAHSKGLAWRWVRDVHLLPNILIPILNTLGASLRFSLASLPVVEVFFHWPGVGSMLLDAIEGGTTPLITDLILSLGVFFLAVNLLIEFSFPLIDPRLRADAEAEGGIETQTWLEQIREFAQSMSAWWHDLWQPLKGQPSSLPPLTASRTAASSIAEAPAVPRRRSWARNLLRNPVFVAGSIMLLVLLVVTLFGESLRGVDPFQVHGIMAVNGVYAAPPFKPSSVFPWGTDHIGRDIRSLVLAGARRTLTLAFFGMLARLVVGTVLGILAGWRRGGWFDHLVSGALGIWAAFPATLFAMIVIQALGIQQGMWVFVVAISLVGWGEVAQFVRGQVIALKPQPFIESARSVGARADQILTRHVFPNLINSITVLAVLEMGGVLMLLAELGFLNIFMGGGFRTMIGESGSMKPVVAYYSDVPEWSALIANVREQWRSYPWMALYPGLAVFLAIAAFNLFGEGLRRFLDEAALGIGRLFNRYTLILAPGAAVVLALVLGASVPLNVYRAEGLKFDASRAAEDIRILASPQLHGRETGSAGADLAALYIAHRMAELGIFPAGEHNSYFQRLIQPRLHLVAMPTLTEIDDGGQADREFTYGTDFREIAQFAQSRGEAEGRVMGVAYGPLPDAQLNAEQFGLANTAAADHVLIVRLADLPKTTSTPIKGILAIADDSSQLSRRNVYPYEGTRAEENRPYILISPGVADDLLRTTGSSLAELDADRSTLGPGQLHLTNEGSVVKLSVLAEESENMMDEAYVNVIGVIPGQGHFMGLEEKVIVVSAYYDGLGTDPTGQIYPGANDNASGVAMMLELARLLKNSSFQPDKTVLFVAWAGGERQEGLSLVNVLNARAGGGDLNVESVIELSGVGDGSGKAIAIGSDSSYRLVRLFQAAAGNYRVPTTTRGRNPHYDLPVRSVFGGRDATTLALSWDGSDDLAHTPEDTFALIDPTKLQAIGRSAYLTLLVLSRETEY